MNKQIKLEPDFSIPLDVVYEDGDVVVLNKQAGISVHPSINEPNKTLVNALIAKYPEIKNVGDPPLPSLSATDGQVIQLRPGIVHRLDKDTSGLLVIAKNQKTFEFLKKEWQGGKVIKKYFALVWGHPKEKGEIISELARSLKDFRKRMVVRPARLDSRSGGPEKQEGKNIKGKLAVTEYRVIKKYKDYSLVEVYPKTGRTHQIRVHFASLGHPVIGDKIYGKNKKKPEGLTRQFLHAFYLKFSLPAGLPAQAGRSLAFETDLPDDLSLVLTGLPK
ncbi:MAG: RluA family pseudouridine synthase [Candidatus Azambacteria bacterium]|nr:RluA family pseudouridine synthase [Candidatus Azambacteria bacterium]